ncbi:MAG: response regulator transcription factor [Coleofasciculaceae cyanobacterium RL_1_1]|nr:response regulator transcription factor [Coleofasciculaceae cyanobacterium RL_1_1]
MPLTILVVDDDPALRMALVGYFELEGYVAIAAMNGRDALLKVDRHQPQLVVTDALMPEMDGFELIRQLRQQPQYRLLPVVFLTARTELDNRIRGYKAGVDVYVQKPVALMELGAIVRNLLDRAMLTGLSQPPTTVGDAEVSLHPILSPEGAAINLTKRERETLALLVEGLSNSEIGDQLFLSSRTIEKYVSRLLDKTQTRNRIELARFAIEHGLDHI